MKHHFHFPPTSWLSEAILTSWSILLFFMHFYSIRNWRTLMIIEINHFLILTSWAILLFFNPFSSSILFSWDSASPGGRELDLCLSFCCIFISYINFHVFFIIFVWYLSLLLHRECSQLLRLNVMKMLKPCQLDSFCCISISYINLWWKC